MNDLKKLQIDPEEFRKLLVIDVDGQHRRLGDIVEHWQDADFQALDPAWKRVAGQNVLPPVLRAWIERPRGHSKTSDIAVMVTWCLFASRRKISGIAAAADRDQAALLRDAVDTLLRLNPWLSKFLTVTNGSIQNTHTGSKLEIISSDSLSSYGLRPDFIIADEVCHWGNDLLWQSLFSSAAKRPSCLLICITNAGFGDSWQWRLRESIKVRNNWYFHRLDGPCASWITADTLAEQQALLPQIAYRRLWLNEWSSGEGDAFSDADLTAAFTLPGPLHSPEPGWSYVAGLDLGVKHDSSALVLVGKHVGHVTRTLSAQPVIASSTLRAMFDLNLLDGPTRQADEIVHHPGSGLLKVCAIRIWKPSKLQAVDLQAVASETELIAKRFKARVAFDPHQALLLAQQLRSAGVPMVETAFTPGNLGAMARATLDAFIDRQISMFPHVDLEADLRSIRIVERSYGIRLDAATRKDSEQHGTRHADSVTALSIALHLASSLRCESRTVGRRLVLSD